jgi:hypothetical protein
MNAPTMVAIVAIQEIVSAIAPQFPSP